MIEVGEKGHLLCPRCGHPLVSTIVVKYWSPLWDTMFCHTPAFSIHEGSERGRSIQKIYCQECNFALSEEDSRAVRKVYIEGTGYKFDVVKEK